MALRFPMHAYEVRPRKDHRGVDLISDVLPFGRLWYDTPADAIGYAMHSSRSHDAVIRVYDEAGTGWKSQLLFQWPLFNSKLLN